jgi:acyl dehydratase
MGTATADDGGERLFAEDIPPGRSIDLGAVTIDAADIMLFGAQWDPQAMHTDEQAAAASPFGVLIASGIQTIAVLQRMTVEHVYAHWHVFAGRQFRSVRFLRPVRAGSVLRGRFTVESVDLNRPTRGLVTSKGAVFVDDEPVLDVVVETYVSRRPVTPGGAPAPPSRRRSGPAAAP